MQRLFFPTQVVGELSEPDAASGAHCLVRAVNIDVVEAFVAILLLWLLLQLLRYVFKYLIDTLKKCN